MTQQSLDQKTNRTEGPLTPNEVAELESLKAKINALLPPRYQDCYEEVKTVSMGSAALVYGPDGKVAWDQIWTSFCDLAIAGGPPHRGTLLDAVSAEEMAVWLMGAVVVENVPARREGAVLFLPASPELICHGNSQLVSEAFANAYRLWTINARRKARGLDAGRSAA